MRPKAPHAGSDGADVGPVIEVLRGRLDRSRAEEVLRFWSARRALSAEEARRRLPEVVCLLRDDGRALGVSSVFPAEVPLIADRRFWIYRSLLDPSATEHWLEMVRATFRTLAAEFDGMPGAPLGLCALIGPDERRRHPEAAWSDPPLVYAGYGADGRQVRVGYFDGAIIRHV